MEEILLGMVCKPPPSKKRASWIEKKLFGARYARRTDACNTTGNPENAYKAVSNIENVGKVICFLINE